MYDCVNILPKPFVTYNTVYGILEFLAGQGLVDCKCPGQHSDRQQLTRHAR
jgi:hypothetical protein